MSKLLVVDVDKCVGCHSCEIACAIAHSAEKDLTRLVQSGEKPGYRIFIESYESHSVPVPCNHCEEAACVLACPTGAAHRESDRGPVLIDESRCIGCRMCVQACPFGMVTVKPSGKGVIKCDLCIERQAQGLKPACVSACPTFALELSAEEEAGRSKRKRIAKIMVDSQKEAEGV